MKYIKNTILLFVIGCMSVSCFDRFDDVKPNFMIPTDDVWSDPMAINAIMAGMYSKLVLEGFTFEAEQGLNTCQMSDEATHGGQYGPAFDVYGDRYYCPEWFFASCHMNGGTWQIWEVQYKLIRNCNEFLKYVIDSPLPDDEKAELSAEVRWIRAYAYFTLVKRFGGVPLMLEAQEYSKDPYDLAVARNTEEDIYDFILKESEVAAEALPVRREVEVNRVTRGAAYALCSRAALYAGSAAKYAKYELNGLVGIPKEKANHYFEIAYKASKNVIDSKVYSLFDTEADKTDNFYKLFITRDNPEYIFVELFDAQNGMGHSYETRELPFSESRHAPTTPTLQMVEAFQYLDGSNGKLNTDKEYDNLMDIFKNKDPRFLASILVPGQPFLKTKVEFQRGVIFSDGSRALARSEPGVYYADEIVKDPLTGKEYTIRAKDGGAYTGNATKTGFHIRKFVRNNLTHEEAMMDGKSDIPFPVFRLAEIYLNLAEAAAEMNRHTSEGLQALNAIRKRAGMPAYKNLDIQEVRDERRVELAFEGHRIWDMVRWRIADNDAVEGGLNLWRPEGLHPYFDARTGKWHYERANDLPKRMKIFQERNNYAAIPRPEILKDSLLIQNPGILD